MYNISIVRYNNEEKDLFPLVIELSKSTDLNRIYLIDNSPIPITSKISSIKRVEYIFSGENIGFGKAHNIALKKSIEDGVKYHLIINPDVKISNNDVSKLYKFLEKNNDAGIVMPKVIYPDGRLQTTARLLPSPFDLIFKRFFPEVGFIKKRIDIYELRFTEYKFLMEIGCASGCCMMVRMEAVKKAGLFDENFFMYLEDIDFSRRIGKFYKIFYFPEVTIVHNHSLLSYKQLKWTFVHIKSAIYYFNKWGWFFDNERKEKNDFLLKKIKKIKLD